MRRFFIYTIVILQIQYVRGKYLECCAYMIFFDLNHEIMHSSFDIGSMFVCVVAATVMLLTSLLVFADNDYCTTSNCLLSPIHWIQLFVSIEVAACLIFLAVYLGKILCNLLYFILYCTWLTIKKVIPRGLLNWFSRQTAPFPRRNR